MSLIRARIPVGARCEMTRIKGDFVMNDYEAPEGGTTENEGTPRSDERTEVNTDQSQTAGTHIGKSTDTPAAEETSSVYVPDTTPPQYAGQQPNPGSQPQSRYQQPAAHQQPGTYQQPAYYAPQGPNQPYSNPPQYGSYPHPSSGKATASLVLGIISLVFFWMSFFAVVSVICSIIGIVLGNSARKELRPEQGQGKATAGLVCSIIGLVLSVIMLVVFTLIIVAAVSFMPDFNGINM